MQVRIQNAACHMCLNGQMYTKLCLSAHLYEYSQTQNRRKLDVYQYWIHALLKWQQPNIAAAVCLYSTQQMKSSDAKASKCIWRYSLKLAFVSGYYV